MSTHSTIWLKKEDGTFEGSYCHFDGYLSGVGKHLFESYKDSDKVKELISLGFISSLDKNIIPTGVHNFKHREKGVTCFYHRDRGDDFMSLKANSLEEAFNEGESFNYFFIDNQWFVEKDEELILLTEKLIQEDE